MIRLIELYSTLQVLDTTVTIINELALSSFVDLYTNQLTPPSELSEWPGVYYDNYMSIS